MKKFDVKTIKIIISAIVLIAMIIILSSCSVGNRQVGMDTIQTFDRYKIVFNGEVIEGNVKVWRDFNDSDVIQITDTNGKVYLTHYMNVLLVRNAR